MSPRPGQSRFVAYHLLSRAITRRPRHKVGTIALLPSSIVDRSKERCSDHFNCIVTPNRRIKSLDQLQKQPWYSSSYKHATLFRRAR